MLDFFSDELGAPIFSSMWAQDPLIEEVQFGSGSVRTLRMPHFPVAQHWPRLCALDRFGQSISLDELTTSIVGIDFPNEDKSKSNRRMECMLCAPGDAVELRLEPTNPYDENAVAIFSERGTQLGYVSAERAPLIGKRMKEGETIAVLQAMH
jgi:hypothetical protein